MRRNAMAVRAPVYSRFASHGLTKIIGTGARDNCSGASLAAH